MFVQTSSELAVRAKIESRQVLEWCHQIIPALGEKLGETYDEMYRAFPPAFNRRSRVASVHGVTRVWAR